MGNFMAWLLGIPTVALVLAYVAICASIVSAKKRMAGADSRARHPARFRAYHSQARNSIGRVQVMVRRGGS